MSRESKIDRKKRTARITAALRKLYPDAKTALRHSNPLQLLVATILSAQCTDARVNIVTKDLFKKYKSAGDYAKARQETFEQEIRTTGFYRNKAKNIIAAAKIIIADFDGKVPENMEDLLSLPGVARKTANIVLGNAFGKNDGIAVDTHVRRLSGRLGLSKHTDPVKIEKDLMELVPRRGWTVFSHLLIFHGRAVCGARKPDCEECAISKLCPKKNRS
ncbi:MAG: endonuclease III [Planctomycetota bacterium]|nr:endonuclease III [Planctomycetota bacterium]